MSGLYIHVPFCGSLCSYCHFSRTADHSFAVRRRFVDAVCRELELRRQTCGLLTGRRRLATVYLGGGTPSQLEPELMTRLLAGTLHQFPQAADLEVTAEANPESLTAEKARAWREAGINRVSLGVQSLNEEVLKLLGRACPPETARKALRLACRHFPRVSADWILGPGLRWDVLRAELQEAIALGVEHFSVYILELHAGTELEQKVRRGAVTLLPDEETEAQYLALVRFLDEQGFRHYEVSNFARPGAGSRHNQGYWRRRPWLALGPAAHGGYGRRRYANLSDVGAYCAAVEAGRIPEESEDPLDLRARLLERIILGLRTAAGVPLAWLAPHCLDWEAGRVEGLWRTDGGRLRLTPRGFLIIDAIEARIRPAGAGCGRVDTAKGH
ncbi:coproporphyrinogen III oxidase [bacterium DOLJORAL78_65_58]|nr:MAG: coproporphyrinogen III oxidase [bacterium DOLZORAL124_64_63]PIE75498.1 MAG: coproporphyrinogen III oxidase [bacterium DOLJORAL78_65_58]